MRKAEIKDSTQNTVPVRGLTAILTAGVILAAAVISASAVRDGFGLLPVHAEETEQAAETASFNSGTTVVPDQDTDYAVTSFGDGVYVIEGGEAVRVFEASMDTDAVLVTDGATVYFTDSSGMLCCGVIGSAGFETLFDTGDLDPAGIAGGTVFLASADTLDGETGILESFGYVVQADLSDGSEIERYEGFNAECCGGYTVLFKRALDVSPRQLYIYDRSGKMAAAVPDAAVYTFDRGVIYVGSYRYGADSPDSCTIRRFVPDGTGLLEEVIADETILEGGGMYGLLMGGYLALFFGSENTYMDMRSREIFPADSMEASGDVWVTGFSSGGTDYVCSSGAFARLNGGCPQKILNVPETGIMSGRTFCAGGWLLTDCFDGQYYIMPVTENEVMPLDLYSSIEIYEDEADGHTVFHCIPHISTDHRYIYEALNDRLEKQSALWEEISNDNMGIGIAAADSSEDVYSFINAYVVRSDTSILSLEQYEFVQREGLEDDYRMVRGVNLNTQTGEELVIGDVVTDLDALWDAVCTQVQAFYGIDAGAFAEYAAGMFPEGGQDRGTAEYAFSVGYEALTFYFASGILEEDAYYSKLLIPYAEFPGLFTDFITDVPVSYAYDIRPFAAEPYAIQDSFRMFCALQAEPQDPWAYDRLLIISGEDLEERHSLAEIPEFPLACDWASGRILHTADGRDYLYLMTDGPETGTSVYQIDTEPSFSGSTALSFSGTAVSEYSEWFADPALFALFEETEKGLQVRCYRTGEDGMPECLEVTGTDAVLYGTEAAEENSGHPAAGEAGGIQYAMELLEIGGEEEDTHAEYWKILPDSRTAEQYPVLADTLSDLNAYQDRYYQDTDSRESSSRYYIRRADGFAFSILEYCTFSDTERDGFAWYSYNIDPETGHFLELQDIVADTDSFLEMLQEAVGSVLDGSEADDYIRNLTEQYEADQGQGLAWTLDPEGITVFLAMPADRYAFGTPAEISLVYDEHPEMFTEKFRKADNGFSMELIAGDFVVTDIGSDGTMDEVMIDWDQSGTLNGSFRISVNGTAAEDNIGISGIRCWYVRTADGHDLVAAASDMGDTGTEYLDFYYLTESAEWTGGLAGRFTGEQKAAEGTEILYSLCDPEDFGIRFRSDIVGTMYLSCRGSLEGEGELYPAEDRLQAETYDGGGWTVLHAFRARELDPETMMPGISTVLPEGTVLQPVFTDGVEYIDCTVNGDDERICRLDIDLNAGGTTVLIGGVFAEELLDGIRYAE